MTTQEVSKPKPTAVVYMPEREFLLPYFRRELEDMNIVTDLTAATEASPEISVMVSSTDIYTPKTGIQLTESTETDANSEWAAREREFSEYCHKKCLPVTIVRCPEVIGTGMRGLAMRMARGIARGTLMHIRGNESDISLIHAVDVAHYAVNKRLTGHTVNLTDGAETSIDELIDALAARMNDKHVLTIKSARIAKALYGRSYYGQLTQSVTYSNELAAKLLGDDFAPNKVTEYLRTHVYDESSL